MLFLTIPLKIVSWMVLKSFLTKSGICLLTRVICVLVVEKSG